MREISVIMPLYNAEKYLPEALNSILRQTYKNFEVLCIDDCSTDNTTNILKDFQRKDKRIRTLENEERLGAARSRKRGLREAQGTYVIFLDGDDVFDEEMLEKAYDAMKETDADIVMFEYMHVISDDIYAKRQKERSAFFLEKYCRHPFSAQDFAPRDFPNWSDAPYDKMIKKEFLCEHSIEFQDLPSCNDVFFSKMASFCAKKIIWLSDRRIMVYARDHFESSRISNDRDPMCVYYAMEKLIRELRKRNLLAELAGYFYYQLSWHLVAALNKEKNEERKRGFYNFLHNEGIARYIEYGKENYIQIDSYDKYILNNFRKYTYESRWFNDLDTYFQFYLKKNERVLYEYICDKLRNNRKIIIWGIGINGKSLLEYMDKRSLNILAIVDSDENRQGDIVNGYKILKPGDIYRQADVILTTSQQTLWEIKEETKDIEIERINVLELLKDYFFEDTRSMIDEQY